MENIVLHASGNLLKQLENICNVQEAFEAKTWVYKKLSKETF